MICDFGDVVVVPFPFIDRAVTKWRPALVISVRSFNEAHASSVMAMITTASKSIWPSDTPIEDGTSAGLQHPSIVRWKLFTLPNDLISHKAGSLSSADRARISAFAAENMAVTNS